MKRFPAPLPVIEPDVCCSGEQLNQLHPGPVPFGTIARCNTCGSCWEQRRAGRPWRPAYIETPPEPKENL